jgi:hypothetical protein
MENEVIRKTEISTDDFRDMIVAFEEKMKSSEGAMIGDCYPLKHSFGSGCYVREISVPAGQIVVTKIHKIDHPCFIMKGVCSVLTERGVEKLVAPMHFITKAGTKRIVYVHEDAVWVTVHVTDETDLEKIEEQVIAKSFDELSGDYKNVIESKKEDSDIKTTSEIEDGGNVCHG